MELLIILFVVIAVIKAKRMLDLPDNSIVLTVEEVRTKIDTLSKRPMAPQLDKDAIWIAQVCKRLDAMSANGLN